jgi:hypothetical protein
MRNPVTLESSMFRPHQPIAILLWLAALAFGAPAAATVSYNFSVEVTSGPLAPQSFSGSFSYDDAVPPAPGPGGADLCALNSFEFDFDGTLYTIADLDYGDAAFAGGTFIGLDAGNATFTFLPAIAPLPPAFLYVSSQGAAGDGNPAFNRVPEPAGALLVAAAFGAMLIRRRRPLNGR